MNLFLYGIVIIIGFFITIKGADLLVEGASSLAKKFGISEIVIGLTIVALGTSAPEMVVNVYSSINGKDQLILGNIIGSNLFNTLIIIGITGIIFTIPVKKSTALKEIPYSLLASLVVLFLVNDIFIFKAQKDQLTRVDGIILLIFFALFLFYITWITLTNKEEIDEEVELLTNFKTTIFLLLGITGLGLGGKLVVDYAVKIAKILEVSDALIGLTILAMGTSLPELVTSIVASKKGKSDIVIGNVIGSNIFNIFLVLSVSALITPISFTQALNIDLMVLSIGSIMLFTFMFTGKKYIIDKFEALIILMIYIGYFIYMMIRM